MMKNGMLGYIGLNCQFNDLNAGQSGVPLGFGAREATETMLGFSHLQLYLDSPLVPAWRLDSELFLFFFHQAFHTLFRRSPHWADFKWN